MRPFVFDTREMDSIREGIREGKNDLEKQKQEILADIAAQTAQNEVRVLNMNCIHAMKNLYVALGKFDVHLGDCTRKFSVYGTFPQDLAARQVLHRYSDYIKFTSETTNNLHGRWITYDMTMTMPFVESTPSKL